MEVDKSRAALTSGETPLPLCGDEAGRSRICLSVDGKHLKVDCGFELDHSKKLKCPLAQMPFCSDAQSPRCPNAVVGRSMPRSGVE